MSTAGHRTRHGGASLPKSKGFRNLLDVPNALPASDFPRPHRKPLMDTIFSRDVRKRYRDARRAAMAAATLAPAESLPKQITGDIVLGVDLRVRRPHPNAVAAAIDHPFVPNSRVPSVRPPVKIPENYLSRLKDLEPIGEQLRDDERIARASVGKPDLLCGLTFDPAVSTRVVDSRRGTVASRSQYSSVSRTGASTSMRRSPSVAGSDVSALNEHQIALFEDDGCEDVYSGGAAGQQSKASSFLDRRDTDERTRGESIYDARRLSVMRMKRPPMLGEIMYSSTHHTQSSVGNVRSMRQSTASGGPPVPPEIIAPDRPTLSIVCDDDPLTNGAGLNHSTVSFRQPPPSVRRNSTMSHKAEGSGSRRGVFRDLPSVGSGLHAPTSFLGQSILANSGRISATGSADKRQTIFERSTSAGFGASSGVGGSHLGHLLGAGAPAVAEVLSPRNLAYMLWVWEHAENVNLASIIEAGNEADGVTVPTTPAPPRRQNGTQPVPSQRAPPPKPLADEAAIRRFVEMAFPIKGESLAESGATDGGTLDASDSLIALPPEQDPLFGQPDERAGSQDSLIRSQSGSAKQAQGLHQQSFSSATRQSGVSRASAAAHPGESGQTGEPDTATQTQGRASRRSIPGATAAASMAAFRQQMQGVHAAADEAEQGGARGLISHSTYRFLKRLSRENQFGLEVLDETLRAADEAMLRRTLTGHSSTADVGSADPFSLDPEIERRLAVSQTFMNIKTARGLEASHGHVDGARTAAKKVSMQSIPHPQPPVDADTSSPFSPQRRQKIQQQRECRKRFIGHGAWSGLVNRIVDSADADPIPTLADEVAALEAEAAGKSASAALQLPEEEIDDLSTEVGSVVAERDAAHAREEAAQRAASGGHDRARHARTAEVDVDEFGIPLAGERTASESVSGRLREIFGKRIIIPHSIKEPLDWGSIFKPIKLRDAEGRLPGEPAPAAPPKFSIERFVTLVKMNTRHHPPERKGSSDPVQEYRANPVPINTLIDFLESPLTALTQMPAAGSVERAGIVKALTLGLREETDKALQYDACRMLIALGSQSELARWDSFIFKGVMATMLKEGTDDERDAAALTFIAANTINETVVGQIMRGLGHLDDDKRMMARKVFSEIDMQHVDMIVPMLLKGSRHTSWRVRLDVIHLLEVWIAKLSPPPPPPPAPRDPDALDTDDDGTIRALFHTLGTTTNERDRDEDLGAADLGTSASSALLIASHAADTSGLGDMPAAHGSGDDGGPSGDSLSASSPRLGRAGKPRSGAGVSDAASSGEPGGIGDLSQSANFGASGEMRRGQSAANLAGQPPTAAQQHQIQLQQYQHQFQRSRHAKLTPAALEHNKQVVKECVDVLLGIMWTDWNKDVRDAASVSLGELRQGRAIFDWVVALLGSSDPVKRVDALRCLSYMAVMTKDALEVFLGCFRDSYASVRIEACKVACMLASCDREIINGLLDLLDDHDHRVRAYAIKALGCSGCKEPKNRETLNWAVHHDPHAAVRAEAIRAIAQLGLIADDQAMREAVFTLLETDKSDRVRREAERVLLACGLIFSNLVETDTAAAKIDSAAAASAAAGAGGGAAGGAMGMPNTGAPLGQGAAAPTTGAAPQSASNASGGMSAPGTSGGGPSNRLTNHSTGPYPHILAGATPTEVEIFLRDSLVGDRECTAAINQVRELATKESIMAEVKYVLKTSDDPIDMGLNLQYNDEFMPRVESIHKERAK
ncbi:HEAT repeat-containing protein 4 [Polyrhizophydium stewartii]|uniref:HEAT repeat-containing protein 4 n=1 Tax=Polyrhizophydium stewartii TaxID=2732419 RepID=A0ABR4N6Z0_9FUNG|nr:HEAT repeat-containing protein 4 [Polyrhizophydium stewartii]